MRVLFGANIDPAWADPGYPERQLAIFAAEVVPAARAALST